jgi:hypothetical protein
VEEVHLSAEGKMSAAYFSRLDHRAFASQVSKAVDRMTDGQIAAKVRQYFLRESSPGRLAIAPPDSLFKTYLSEDLG